ncbi:MAG TPA: hypothetical protein VGX25_27510 [Actinophytocola sp.]|uniref:hypothetical protein n=1 Tax=Actinophytocola sp. TaxID=1872138 RepID=UPI002DDD27FE|nr:hypothetical protein [Actinophytocola sp.]HEV2783147.1 hypothetical protein [Actinophytocola sp.]
MINEESLRRALGTLERHAPAEADVLAGLRAGLARRRRRQVASVAGVAGAACAVALGVVVAVSGRGEERVGGSPAPPTAPAGESSAPVAIASVIPPPALPFTVGWLPDGYTLARWDVGTADNYAYYGVGPQELESFMVGVSTRRPAAPAGAVEEPTTIAGRPGVVHKLGRNRAPSQLLWQLADGRWAVVGGRPPTMPLDTFRRIAESLAPQPTPLTVPFGLTKVPDGYRVVRWTNQGPVGASLTLCPTGVDPFGPAGDACLSVSLDAGPAPTAMPRRSNSPGGEVVMVPLDREQVIGGVRTYATADGTAVVAQVDPGHYATGESVAAGVGPLREAVAAVVLTR